MGIRCSSHPESGPCAADGWHCYSAASGSINQNYFTVDNPSLFRNILGTVLGKPGVGTFNYDWTSLASGHINAPGTFLLGSRWTFPPTLQLGPFGSCTGGSSYQVGAWGYGASAGGCPDEVPLFPLKAGMGVRVNAEVISSIGTSMSNVQSFLAIQANTAPPEGVATGRPSRRSLEQAMKRSGKTRFRSWGRQP